MTKTLKILLTTSIIIFITMCPVHAINMNLASNATSTNTSTNSSTSTNTSNRNKY